MSTKYKFNDQDKLYFVSFAVINWIDLFAPFRRESDDRAYSAKATRAPLTGSQHAYRFALLV